MRLSSKDKSLLILIFSLIIIAWFIGSITFNIFYSTKYNNVDLKKIITNQDENWFNLSRNLEVKDLEDRVILLYFWSYSCFNCTNNFDRIKKLQDKFGSKLLVIGVHSPIFENEKNYNSVKKAVLRYDLSHPVINDLNHRIKQSFDIKELPTYLIINPYGVVKKRFIGDDNFENIEHYVKKIIDKYKYQISRDLLPIILEKYNTIGNVLSFPTKLAYANNFNFKSRQLPVIFIANSGQNSITISSITGDILLKIGSSRAGFVDGNFEDALFNSPQGLLYHDNKLYVADTANHAIRLIDFKEQKVKTIIGNGFNGGVINDDNLDGKEISLSSPSDLEFFPDNSNLVISNAGSNQILIYNINDQDLSVFAGNGDKGSLDGKYPKNSLAQTSDLAVYNDKLYFLDASSSLLRVSDQDGEVKTLAGQDQLNSNLSSQHQSLDGKLDNLKINKNILQSPKALTVDDTGIYISDSLNNRIKKYDFSSNQIRDLVGSIRGEEVGNKTTFDEPNGIISVLDRFYLADTNNNRILIINRSNFESELLNIMPPLKLSKDGILEYLPIKNNQPIVNLKADVEIQFQLLFSQGWKINDLGPSFLNLLEINDDQEKQNQANLIANYDWNMIKNKNITLSKLSAEKKYLLQGKFYYCKDGKNSLCYIKDYQQKLLIKESEINDKIQLKLGN